MPRGSAYILMNLSTESWSFTGSIVSLYLGADVKQYLMALFSQDAQIYLLLLYI